MNLEINDDIEYLGYKGYIIRITDTHYSLVFPSYSKRYRLQEVTKYFNPISALVPKSDKVKFVNRNEEK
jgi:hypothetical protein